MEHQEYNVSKELFEIVMNEDKEDIRYELHFCNSVEISYHDKKVPEYKTISINDFFFKCLYWITNINNSPEMLCSHKLFYLTTDKHSWGEGINGDWYCGYAHSKTTYDKDQTVEDISEGFSIQQSLFNACQHVLDKKVSK